jgi:hypothetical protein
VFENPIGGGRLSARQVQRRLDSAMIDAGIPKLHPELRLPRSFHSFRYTTSVLMQRRGYHPALDRVEPRSWFSRVDVRRFYGGWTPDQLAAEAARTPGRRPLRTGLNPALRSACAGLWLLLRVFEQPEVGVRPAQNRSSNTPTGHPPTRQPSEAPSLTGR